MHTSHAGFGGAKGLCLSRVAIVIIGRGPFWTQRSCAAIETEFDAVCLRLDSLEAAEVLAPGLTETRLVVVDQSHAEDLLARTGRYFGLCPPAMVALAYRESEVARDLERRYDERFGPMGYLPMSAPDAVWLSSIRLLLHGEPFLPSDLRTPHGADAADRKPAAPPKENSGAQLRKLTEREREVLNLASAGDSNKLISRKLAISEHTVKLHMHNVYEKLGVANRTAAASLLLHTVDRPAT